MHIKNRYVQVYSLYMCMNRYNFKSLIQETKYVKWTHIHVNMRTTAIYRMSTNLIQTQEMDCMTPCRSQNCVVHKLNSG